MSGHTPGPWEATPVEGENLWVVTRLGTNHFIAETGTLSPDGSDARLIAAAPELLEACKKLLETNGSPYDHDWRSTVIAYDEAMALAKTAIAKAEAR